MNFILNIASMFSVLIPWTYVQGPAVAKPIHPSDNGYLCQEDAAEAARDY